MKKFIKSRSAWEIVIVSLLAFFATVGVVLATTTIGTNINTEGTLTANGVTTIYGATSIGGALTATSTLAVNGASTLTGAVTIYGATSIGGALTATSTFKIGTLSSTVPGSGFIISDTTNRVVDINVDDNNVASADTAKTISAGRFRLMRYADSVAEDYALHGLVKYSELTKSRWGAGVIGAAETTGAVTLSNLTTGVLGRFGTAATLTLTGATDRIAAVTAFNNNSVALAGSGKSVGLLVMETDVGTPINLDYGLEIKDNVATTDISLGAATTGINFAGTMTKDISLQYGETIDNATDGVISLTGIASTTSIRLANLETIANATNGTIRLATDGGATIDIAPTAAGATITPGGTGTVTIGGAFSVSGYATTTSVGIISPVSTTTAPTCNSAVAGGMIWNSTKAKTCVCSGSNWTEATSNTPISCF